MNKQISTEIAIFIILILAIAVGMISYFQFKLTYEEIEKVRSEFSEFEIPEKKDFLPITCQNDSDCICCDTLLVSREKEYHNICVNETIVFYADSDNLECLQIDSVDSFCLENECKCKGGECFSVEKGQEVSFSQRGNLVKDMPGLNEGWYLSYEEPGAPGLSVMLVFNKETKCDFMGENNCEPFIDNSLIGEKVFVFGTREGEYVSVKNINLLE
jgi:hypothetical protein